MHPESTLEGVSSSHFTGLLEIRAEHLADADFIQWMKTELFKPISSKDVLETTRDLVLTSD
jgi:hypothetical protein